MNSQHDYAATWPEMFRFVPPATRDSVVRALQSSADSGTPPTEADAQLLVDFATGQITAREYSRRTLARLTGQPEEPMPEPIPAAVELASAPVVEVTVEPAPIAESAVAEPPVVEVPTPTPTPTPILDHEAAALAFVRGEVTAEQYLRNARNLRGRSA